MEIRFISSAHVRAAAVAAADAELPLPVARSTDLSGRVLGSRYSLRRRIGGGSMGTVYEARDMTLGTAVAVKVLHPDYGRDADFRRRFHQEALLGPRLRHAHSVAVTDLGETDDGLFYSVMEYLEGESLDALLSSSPAPLPWRRVVTIIVQVCAALQAAHERGVIHRDLKPGNCFLVRRDRHDEHEHDPDFTFVKVLDLGLARLRPAGGRPTPPGRLGAPEYLAPEQVQGFTCDHRVDLYAVGVMMYQLLTRRLPFTGDSPAAIMAMHIEAAPAPLVQSDPDIPAGLEAVVLRALAKSPADRFPDARTLAKAIQAAAAEAEAEAIAIVEAVDEPPPDPLATRVTRPPATPPSATPLPSAPLPSAPPRPGLRAPRLSLGLLGLLVALASILAVALTILIGHERVFTVQAPRGRLSERTAPADMDGSSPDA
jgi:serine/threonine protein kinase